MAKSKRRIISQNFYNQRTLHKEREYGFYWYSWLWHILRPLLIFTISIVIVGGLVISGWNRVYDNFLKPMDPDNEKLVAFRIERGQSVTRISESLYNQELLRNKGIFKYLIMFQGLTSKIQFGDYYLSPSMTVSEIVSALTSGTAITERNITIIPGWTVEDIADYLLKIGAISDRDTFLALCNDVPTFRSFSHELSQAETEGRLGGRRYALEGYLAPNTYRVFVTATPAEIIRTLLAQTEILMGDLYFPSEEDGEIVEPASLLSEDEIIVLASMIEKEAAQKDDFARVSAVFYNRLALGMKLESDPTIKYTLGVTNMVLTSEQLGVDTPYNTYVIPALPVGPICNPSPAALEAALHPNQEYLDEEYLFFCSKDPNSGELYFSKTYEEHLAAVAEYRPLWEAFDEAQRNATPTPQPSDTPDPNATIDPNATTDPNASEAPASQS